MKTGGRGVPGFMKIPFFGNHVGPKMTGISGRFQVIDCIYIGHVYVFCVQFIYQNLISPQVWSSMPVFVEPD